MPEINRKTTTSHQKQHLKSSDVISHVSPYTFNIPKIKQKSDCSAQNTTTKDCMIHEISNDTGESTKIYARNKQCDNFLEHLTRKPVVITFKKHEGTYSCSTNFKYSKKSNKVQHDLGNKICKVANQSLTLAETRNAKPSTSSTLLCYGSFENKNDEKTKLLEPKLKERWHYSDGLTEPLQTLSHGKDLNMYPNQIHLIHSQNNAAVEYHPFQSITDQELNDGLPDV